MQRYHFLPAIFFAVYLVGCSGEPGPVQRAAQEASAGSAAAESAPPQHEPAIDYNSAGASNLAREDRQTEQVDDPGAREMILEQSPVRLMVPADWRQVKPPNRIVEVAFELPRAEGDESDGRLTLMSASGDPQETIDRRSAEFRRETGDHPIEETVNAGDVEVRLIDLRGEWKDSNRPSEPRPDFRMLLAIVPLSRGSAFYAKLLGPRATVAAHESEFRKFVRSVKITR